MNIKLKGNVISTKYEENNGTDKVIEQLEQENINLMLASAEMYETMYQENVNLMLAVAEVYEMMLGGV